MFKENINDQEMTVHICRLHNREKDLGVFETHSAYWKQMD